MISPDWCRLMAGYNAEMNRRLYAAADRLTEAQRREERGAFWGSVHGTLSHLVWGDRVWMSRFADGWERPSVGIKESGALFAEWPALRDARVEADSGIESWAAGLTETWLAAPLTWTSGITGRTATMPRWFLVTHFFNHQTHHRGQAHCLLTGFGEDPGVTDLPWVVDLSQAG